MYALSSCSLNTFLVSDQKLFANHRVRESINQPSYLPYNYHRHIYYFPHKMRFLFPFSLFSFVEDENENTTNVHFNANSSPRLPFLTIFVLSHPSDGTKLRELHHIFLCNAFTTAKGAFKFVEDDYITTLIHLWTTGSFQPPKIRSLSSVV